MSKTRNKTCRWCPGVEVHHAQVVVGKPGNERTVPLVIDVHPHPEGRVVVREHDGAFRMVGPRQRIEPNRDAYRVHGSHSCGRPRGEGAAR